MTNTVLGVPIRIDIKDPSKKTTIVSLIVELKKQSDDNLLNYMLDGILKALNSEQAKSLFPFSESGVQSVKVSGVIIPEKTRAHKLDQHQAIIKKYLSEGLSFKKIWIELRDEHKVQENYQNLRNYILKNKLI